MTVETRTVRRPIYIYPLISWTSVLAGVAVAIALAVLFTVLGVAIGATALNPFNLGHDAKALSIGGGLWTVFATLVSLQVGGFVAARNARYPDHANGMLQGLTVWAVTMIAILLLAGPSLAAGISGAAGAAVDEASMGPSPTVAAEAQVGSAARTAGQLTDAEMDQLAIAAKKTTAALAWWATAAMALGAVGAIVGGRIGAQHPEWLDRPREAAFSV
jgi:hypothetical protein